MRKRFSFSFAASDSNVPFRMGSAAIRGGSRLSKPPLPGGCQVAAGRAIGRGPLPSCAWHAMATDSSEIAATADSGRQIGWRVVGIGRSCRESIPIFSDTSVTNPRDEPIHRYNRQRLPTRLRQTVAIRQSNTRQRVPYAQRLHLLNCEGDPGCGDHADHMEAVARVASCDQPERGTRVVGSDEKLSFVSRGISSVIRRETNLRLPTPLRFGRGFRTTWLVRLQWRKPSWHA